MDKCLAILILLACASLLGQQAPSELPRRPICTPVPKGEIVKRTMPAYPKDVPAKALAEGVVVKLTIDKQGVPKDLHATKGDPALAKAAVDALRQWRWKPSN